MEQHEKHAIRQLEEQIANLTRRHEAAVDSLSKRCRALEGGDYSPAHTSVVALLDLVKDALVRVTKLEGGEVLKDLRALSGRVQAIGVRIDQLEAGHTGRIVGERLVGHAMQRHGDPTTAALERMAAEHRKTLERLGDATDLIEQMARAAGMSQLGGRAECAEYVRKRLADLGDTIAHYRAGNFVSDAGEMAIATLTKERDEARRALKMTQDERDHEVKCRRDAETKLEQMTRHRNTLGAQIDQCRTVCSEQFNEQATGTAVVHTVQMLEAQLKSAHDASRRQMADTETVRQALELATADRDRFNAGMMDANKRVGELQIQRTKDRTTIADQAAQITELRAANRSITELLEGLCMDCGGIGLQGAKDSAKVVRDHIKITTEALRVADADRVPLRMDLDIATAHLKERTAECDRMRPFVNSAAMAANAWQHELDAALRGLSEPLYAALCAMADAAGVYEEACSQAADAEKDHDPACESLCTEGAACNCGEL